jgi:DNA mismatch repair protein MutH
VDWDEGHETPDENLLGLWSEPVMTTLVGVAPLLGGVTEECSHLPHLLEVVSLG